MSQENLGIILNDFIDALRCGDLATVAARLAPDVVWQGVRGGLVCRDRDEVLAVLGHFGQSQFRIDALELIDGGEQVVLGVRGPQFDQVGGVELGGQIFNVFTLHEQKIVHMRDYRTRADAVAAAGLSGHAEWR